jgi:hypothetical protein
MPFIQPAVSVLSAAREARAVLQAKVLPQQQAVPAAPAAEATAAALTPCPVR